MKGDYIEFLAEMDLLCALSACPQGDVSNTADDTGDVESYPLDVYVGHPSDDLLDQWRNQPALPITNFNN